MTYWKIQFDEGLTGTGWLVLNEQMEAVDLTDDGGTPITTPVGYHPIELNAQPEWA